VGIRRLPPEARPDVNSIGRFTGLPIAQTHGSPPEGESTEAPGPTHTHLGPRLSRPRPNDRAPSRGGCRLFGRTTTRRRGRDGQDDGDTPGCTLRGGVLYVGGHFNVAGPDCQSNHMSTCSTRHHVAAFDTRHNKLLSWNPTPTHPTASSSSPTADEWSPSAGSSLASADTPNKASPSTQEATWPEGAANQGGLSSSSGVLARLVTDGRAAALVEPRAMLVITGIGVATILLRRARRVGRCDWCGGRFCDDGLCVRCRRPA
jgi:hypothetical protein